MNKKQSDIKRGYTKDEIKEMPQIGNNIDKGIPPNIEKSFIAPPPKPKPSKPKKD